MIELPESISLARQLNETVQGKRIVEVIANAFPHKQAWFSGDPHDYISLLTNKRIGTSAGIGGKVEINAEDKRILLAEGVRIQYYSAEQILPEKHQLLLKLSDGTALVCSVQMYGGIWAFTCGMFDNELYLAAKNKPSPLSEKFDLPYFLHMAEENSSKSVKALLTTEQRIPGFGNGVMQDVLFEAKVHPKTKLMMLSKTEKKTLYNSIRETLQIMADQGGRDTEKDLFGNPGGYRTKMSKFTVGQACPICGAEIVKQTYMGGSIYYCPICQPEWK